MDEGGNCSAETLNIPLQFATQAEHEACKSGTCYCDSCTNTSMKKHSKPGAKCSEDSDCNDDMFCQGSARHVTDVSKLGCTGTCQKKVPLGQRCYSGWHESCQSGKCQCDTCVDAVTGRAPSGGSCDKDSDCIGSSMFCKGGSGAGNTGTCTGTCTVKYPDGHYCHNNDLDSCQSNECICNICGRTHSEGKTCANDSDCDHNLYCHGTSWDNRCVGTCRKKADDYHACSSWMEDRSCKSGMCKGCNVCTNSSGKLPNSGGGKTYNCKIDSHCQSHWCQGSSTNHGPCDAGYCKQHPSMDLQSSPGIAPPTEFAIHPPAQSPVEIDKCDIECEINIWKQDVDAREIDLSDIPSECTSQEYDIGLYSFPARGSHFIIVATKSEPNKENDACPSTIALTSVSRRKLALHISQQDLVRDFNIHDVGKVSLDLLAKAEENVSPIDDMVINIMPHYCAQYMQDILHLLDVEMTSALATFFVDNLLHDPEVINKAKEEAGTGSIEDYVEATVLTQLGIM